MSRAFTLNMFFLMAVCCYAFIGCTKNPSIDQVGIQMRFINVSPDAASVQVKLNDQNAFTPALSFNDTTTYLPFTSGTYNMTLALGTTVPVSTIIDLTPQVSYSIFAVDSAKKIKLSVIKDDLSPVNIPLRAKVRFFNLSPNAGALSLIKIVGTDTTFLSSGRTFNDLTSSQTIANFSVIPSNFYKFLLVSGSTILATLPSQLISSEGIYTIYAKGFVGGIGTQAISLGILVNK